jgi:tetratricopeptide (TPR) repeat protein
MARQEYDRAIATLNQVVASDQEPARVVRALDMLACCHAAEGRHEAAIAELDKILADSSAAYAQFHPTALYFKADCYHREGRDDDAKATAEDLLSRLPDCPAAELARTLLQAIGAAPSS